MFAPTATFLVGVDRLGSRLGPLSRVITALADRFVPQATAEAACSGGWVFCYSECDADTYCQTHFYLNRRYDFYAPNRGQCDSPTRLCDAGCRCDG